MKTALCIFGLPGSGKSTFVSVAEENGIPSVIMGDVVRDKAEKELDGENVTGQDIGEWATKQRDKHGEDIMAVYTAERVNKLDTDIVVVEGVRSQFELDVFEEEMHIETVYIKADFETRLHRLQNRTDDRAELSENGVTVEELKKRDKRELSWGLDDLINLESGYVIDNSSLSLEEYECKIMSVIDNYSN